MSGITVLLFEKVSKTEFRHSIFEEPGMRKAYSKQRRLDSVPINQVELNLDCRDSIIPVLRALQHVYSDWTLTGMALPGIFAGVSAAANAAGMAALFFPECSPMKSRFGSG